MAGLSGSTADGWRITVRINNKPKTIRLRASERTAGEWRTHIERIIQARLTGAPLASTTAAWLGDLPDETHQKLSSVGLVEAREAPEVTTLDQLLTRFVERATVKPSTLAVYKQGADSLRGHFGKQKPVNEITAGDADDWRKGLIVEGLAPATQAKRTRVAKSIFKRAVRWGMIDASPFDHLKVGSQHNDDRRVYVPREVIADVLAACPDDEWRAVIGLVRFAGLRCPSEVGLLRWSDVDWERSRLAIRSPKTAGHDGHAVRVAPMVPELAAILQRLFDRAEDGAVRVAPRLADSAKNMRTHFQRIIIRAGHSPWPRLFHALRASCATDWAQNFPSHVASKWLGHSPVIAARHYLTVSDDDYARAVATNPATSTPEGGNESGNASERGQAHGSERIVTKSGGSTPYASRRASVRFGALASKTG